MYDEATDTIILIWAIVLLITVMVLIVCCVRKYIFKSKNKQPAHPQPICESPPKIVQENVPQPDPVQEKSSLALSSLLRIVGIVLPIAAVLLALIRDNPFCMSEDTLNKLLLDIGLIWITVLTIVMSYCLGRLGYKNKILRKAKKGIHENYPQYLLSLKSFIWHFRIFWGILIAFMLVIFALPFLENSKLAASINKLSVSISKFIGSINKDTIILIFVIIMVLILIALVCYCVWYYSQVERFKQQLRSSENIYKGIPKAYRPKAKNRHKTSTSKALDYFVIFLCIIIIAVAAFLPYKDTDPTMLALFIYVLALILTGLATLINFTTSPPGKLFHWYEIVFFILLLPLYVLILLVKDQDKSRGRGRHGRRR